MTKPERPETAPTANQLRAESLERTVRGAIRDGEKPYQEWQHGARALAHMSSALASWAEADELRSGRLADEFERRAAHYEREAMELVEKTRRI